MEQKYSKKKELIAKFLIKKVIKKRDRKIDKAFNSAKKEIKKIETDRMYGAPLALAFYLAGGQCRDAIEEMYESDYRKIDAIKDLYNEYKNSEMKGSYKKVNEIAQKYFGEQVLDEETGERLTGNKQPEAEQNSSEIER